MGKNVQIFNKILILLKIIITVFLWSQPAFAGGAGGGEADTDILYTDGTYSFRTSAIYVSPSRKFSTLNGARANDGVYSDNFGVFGVGIKAQITPNLACALTYTRPFAASTTYGTESQNAEAAVETAQGYSLLLPSSKLEVSTDEYGSTCDVHFQAGLGNLHLIGGIFLETFEYKQNTWLGNVVLKDDGTLGYRMGLAYDIPEYAMRFQVLYRSEVKHDAEGNFNPSVSAIANGISGDFSAVGQATLPQSLKIYGQTGIAPEWLVYGSVTWTNWSVLQSLSYDVINLATNSMALNYKDGYTIQGGIGHQFTESLSGTVNVTWDEGVGTGADIATDTWTLGVGGEYKTKVGTFDLGGTVSYLTEGSQRIEAGAPYDATAKGNWAVAVGMSYLLEF
jgi:long-chain fatty acid transport protein